MTVDNLTSLPVAAFVGAMSGTHASIWGMYKDSIHEGFGAATFSRSIVIGAAAATVLHWWLQLDLSRASAIALLFGLAYAVERGLVETWKTFVRDEDQSKYFIPMQFSIRGQPVRDQRWRLAAGAGYVAIVAVCLAGIADMGRVVGPVNMPRAALVGLVVGTIIAIGGGWKDAPKEGFDLLKFFRSPAMTVCFALALSRITSDYLLIAAAAIGFERAAAETYKTFFFPEEPRGKFAGKPVLHPEMLTHRRRFVPVYAAITCSILALLGAALLP
jgi:hypothetical protein